jgi:uncharacterized protein (TIGR03435 family)
MRGVLSIRGSLEMQRSSGDVRENHRRLFVTLAGSVGFVIACGCGLSAAIPSHLQSQTTNATSASTSWTYEIVSIRPANPNTDPNDGGTEELSDGYKATNVTLLTLIRRAYGIEIKNQISGGPSWLNSDAYDIQAKLDASAADALKKLTPSQKNSARQQMLQALLADRFKLIVHRENRELPVYLLVVGKNGPKLHKSKLGANPDEIHDSSLESGRGGGKIITPSITTQNFAGMLTLALGRTVLDKTNLAGSYDLTLQWTTDRAELPIPKSPDSSQRGAEAPSVSDPVWPSIFTAIQEQLGLKLEEGKGPVAIIVIDHVEKPSGN